MKGQGGEGEKDREKKIGMQGVRQTEMNTDRNEKETEKFKI